MRRVLAAVAVAAGLVTVSITPAAAQPISLSSFYTPAYGWWQDQPAVRLQPTSTHVCVLTRVGGHFQGDGEAVRVYQSNGWWYLGGHSQQDGVHGTARCFRQSSFTSIHGSTHWVSADQGVTVTTASSCYNGGAPLWWGDAATIMTGIRGNFAGAGESAGVTQSVDGRRSSDIHTGGCQDDSLWQVWGYSFFVGRPHAGDLATFLPHSSDRYAKNPGTAATVPESMSTAANGNGVTRLMARADWAMCYLTEVRGKLRGADDYVEIVPEDVSDDTTDWVLRTHSATTDGISAKARCYARNQ
ncbi:hypothetical protein ACFQ1S_09335 [Kibdelosporangium lantanae]|uniref:Uncharacterized protein n=1 Tax=Kibdelosporangium lantanae TaxID=1497396 RepID=A0ABW3M839_9PSEU